MVCPDRQRTCVDGKMCVYECRHPLWGGSGTCTNDNGPTCSCDAGYAVVDALGFPSCVRALNIIYWALTVAAAAMVVFILWHAEKDRHLAAATRATRRAKLRKCVVVCAGDFGPTARVPHSTTTSSATSLRRCTAVDYCCTHATTTYVGSSPHVLSKTIFWRASNRTVRSIDKARSTVDYNARL